VIDAIEFGLTGLCGGQRRRGDIARVAPFLEHAVDDVPGSLA